MLINIVLNINIEHLGYDMLLKVQVFVIFCSLNQKEPILEEEQLHLKHAPKLTDVFLIESK